MANDHDQLKRNRARVGLIAAGLFFLGSQGPDFGDLFDHHGGDNGRAHHDQIVAEDDRAAIAADQVAEMADRAVELAERAADAAERASEGR